MKTYQDHYGWQYKVMAHEGGFRIYSRREEDWESFFIYPTRKTIEAAEADLDEMATEEGWGEVDG